MCLRISFSPFGSFLKQFLRTSRDLASSYDVLSVHGFSVEFKPCLLVALIMKLECVPEALRLS